MFDVAALAVREKRFQKKKAPIGFSLLLPCHQVPVERLLVFA